MLLRAEDSEEERRYQIVGEDEANIKEGKISFSSPIARALIGKSTDDVVDVQTPGGIKTYKSGTCNTSKLGVTMIKICLLFFCRRCGRSCWQVVSYWPCLPS